MHMQVVGKSKSGYLEVIWVHVENGIGGWSKDCYGKHESEGVRLKKKIRKEWRKC